jgi:hypothetical protein
MKGFAGQQKSRREAPIQGSVPQTVATFREFAPNWAALSHKARQLAVREEEIIAEISTQQRAAKHAVAASGGTLPMPEVEHNTRPAPRPAKPMGQRVKELLSGAPLPEAPSPDLELPFSKRMREVAAELEDVRDARALVVPALTAAHMAESRRYCGQPSANTMRSVSACAAR